MVIEVNFPRGGRKLPEEVKPTDFDREDDLFDQSEINRKRLSEYDDIDDKNEIETATVDLLSEKTIQDGMVLLGCIKNKNNISLVINLPGRIYGKVFVTNISKPYTKLLQSVVDNGETESYNQVNELFTPGQCVAVKVLNARDEKYGIVLSMMPQDINANISHFSVKTGMVLWGAISSCEDHGYVVDLGVKNCRAFLKKDDCQPGKEYVVGESLWFGVQKCNISQEATVVKLLTNSKFNAMKLKERVGLDYLLPGTKVDFTITELLKNGLSGKIFNDYTSYIHYGQLYNINKRQFKEHDIIEARIIYIMPVTKFIYLTLKSLKTRPLNEIKEGSLEKCQIAAYTPYGIYVNIKKFKGFVALYRLQNEIKNNTKLNDSLIVRRKYIRHSQHRCRILNYDFFDELYICTLEKSLTDRNMIYSLNDLKVGQKVSAVIKEIQSNGLLVKIDNITGYIKNEHICDGILRSYNYFKSKFKEGQTVDARVWILNPENNALHLTMKPTLVNTEQILTSYEHIKKKKEYPGVIHKITKNGVVVKFFGDIFGWVPKDYLHFRNIENPELLFKLGQLVNAIVVRCTNKNKLILSLVSLDELKRKNEESDSDIEEEELKLGEHVDVTVLRITKAGLHVKVKNSNLTAIIPLLYLTKFPNLAHIIAGMYNPGDEIPNTVCVKKSDTLPVVSLWDINLDESNIPDFNDMAINTVLPCSILAVDSSGISIETPILNYEKYIFVPRENVSDKEHFPDSELKCNQLVYAKVINISKSPNSITASIKLNDVWDYNINSSVNYFWDYLNEVFRIRDYVKSLNNPLGHLKLGEVVSGVVKTKLENQSLLVELKNGARAIVQPEYQGANISINSKVEGVILWWNFEQNLADLVLCPKVISRINPVQDGNTNIVIETNDNNRTHAEILLVKKDFALGVLRGTAGKRQLIFLPIKLHNNDFYCNSNDFIVGKYVHIEISQIQNGIIIGFLKQVMKNVKQKQRMGLKRRRALLNEEKEKLKTNKIKRNKLIDKNTEENNIDNKGKLKNKNEKLNVVNEKKKKDNKNSNNKLNMNEELKTEEITNEKINKTKKRKIKNENLNKEDDADNFNKKNKKNKIKQNNETRLENDSDHIEKIEKSEFELTEDDLPILTGANTFWNVPQTGNVENESSDEDEQEQKELFKLQKKKKLTPAERAEAARLEEERIREIELELADAESSPKTADQFDRLLLSDPNNSLIWLNYMAFHIMATEIEKARSVARKALNTIEFREEQERFNVWIAFLHLENRYGSKESFGDILEEAVKMNDALPVYLQALFMLSESKKITEFNELLRKVTKKFKSEFEMWTKAAEACYKYGLNEQARDLMQRSLKSLDKKKHINLIVQFAFMESKYNEPERGEALLEKVLASYPRRVDVWTSYIDMLIKSNRIHIARNILERAIGQKLPAKKMKTLFTKYLQFENKYGNEESVQKVRQLAANYVNTALK